MTGGNSDGRKKILFMMVKKKKKASAARKIKMIKKGKQQLACHNLFYEMIDMMMKVMTVIKKGKKKIKRVERKKVPG